ncbi:MAG: Rpp14/Pop5 family protein [Candidatus Micrarchaeia archaeon]|jgi:RNase P/RNase MRP subunit POP5
MKSSIRDDFRYVYAKYEGEKLNSDALESRVENHLLLMLGALGKVEAGFKVMFATEDNVCIRCIRGYEQKICAALALANSWDGKPMRLKVLRIAGTIKSGNTKEKIKRKRKRFLDTTKNKGKTNYTQKKAK